eukprot:CAMPEP_0168344184 /NCGR_PEP_ID=MMETSP0213-20121227/16649_1 /TAXON_ID=151035 /ORGANISM="Euplotes harpa, Strain FSP1.4" /LENGTH=165 /DNA_ID=CAMNT_0008351845 /DNA_START=288 /DNA_END=785 /DNA_ORIENTATION=-
MVPLEDKADAWQTVPQDLQRSGDDDSRGVPLASAISLLPVLRGERSEHSQSRLHLLCPELVRDHAWCTHHTQRVPDRRAPNADAALISGAVREDEVEAQPVLLVCHRASDCQSLSLLARVHSSAERRRARDPDCVYRNFRFDGGLARASVNVLVCDVWEQLTRRN